MAKQTMPMTGVRNISSAGRIEIKAIETPASVPRRAARGVIRRTIGATKVGPTFASSYVDYLFDNFPHDTPLSASVMDAVATYRKALAAQPDDNQTTRVGPAIALDHTGDDLALMGRELAVIALVLGVAEPLQHHLPCGGGGNPAETLRSVLPFAEHVAVLVELAGHHADRPRFAVDVDVRIRLMAFGV